MRVVLAHYAVATLFGIAMGGCAEELLFPEKYCEGARLWSDGNAYHVSCPEKRGPSEEPPARQRIRCPARWESETRVSLR